MNKPFRTSAFLNISISLAVIMILAFITVLYIKAGTLKALVCFASLVVAGVCGIGTLFCKKNQFVIQQPQRSRLIDRQTTITGCAASYLIVFLAFLVIFFLLRPVTTISAAWLPNVLGASGLTYFLTHSIAVLVLYGSGNKPDKFTEK